MKHITTNNPDGLYEGYYLDETAGEITASVKESIPSGPGRVNLRLLRVSMSL